MYTAEKERKRVFERDVSSLIEWFNSFLEISVLPIKYSNLLQLDLCLKINGTHIEENIDYFTSDKRTRKYILKNN